MKRLFLSLAALVLASSALFANPLAHQDGVKITKNEAEHIALKERHDARVTNAKLDSVEGRKVWVIEVSDGKKTSTVMVDALSGHIVAPKKGDR